MYKKIVLAFLMIFTVAMSGCEINETLDLVNYDELNTKENVKLSYIDLNYDENQINCLLENNSAIKYSFEWNFSIERKQGDKWYQLNKDQYFIAMAGEIEPNSTHVFHLDLDTEIYELSVGDYRIVKTLYYGEEGYKTVYENYSFEFSITEKNKAPVLN